MVGGRIPSAVSAGRSAGAFEECSNFHLWRATGFWVAIDVMMAVTRQVPREDPRARRAMTENGFYVIYAPDSIRGERCACNWGELDSRHELMRESDPDNAVAPW